MDAREKEGREDRREELKIKTSLLSYSSPSDHVSALAESDNTTPLCNDDSPPTAKGSSG